MNFVARFGEAQQCFYWKEGERGLVAEFYGLGTGSLEVRDTERSALG